MKKNEAPEKIHLHPDLDSVFGMTERSCENEIEYTRTDAFIEKAEKWIDNFLSESTLIDYEVTPIVRNAVIDNFKNFMKG